ncbi:Ig-like domain repeat protein [Methanobrevibacter sp. UBA188]|uniref:Ig-like domain repeat protein n=1 Tax=Methanobrevibacter sp. UBA188 TaxID=1915473 RepID=UPI0025E8A61E|nr:Ig-like domain repeat protein [Methanobrevibacter sp. UBA188]
MFISLILLSVVLLSASVAFAATDDNATVSEVNNEIAIDEDTLTASNDVVIQENDTSSAESNVVTNSTFYQYFDNTGTIYANVTSEELVFEGDFSNLGVDSIIINKPIKFSGNDATINGMSINICADNVTVDGFKLIQNNDPEVIYAYNCNNVEITNNVIEFEDAAKYSSYGIWANCVDNFKLINNAITYVGHTNGTTINNVVRVEGDGYRKANNVVISGNVFNITIPSAPVQYDDNYNSVDYTNGIVVLDAENVTIDYNEITLEYSNATGAYDTIKVIAAGNSNFDYDDFDYLYTCKNVNITNNIIVANGHTYIYGIHVTADNFLIDNNNLIVSSDSHYADAITVDGPSDVGMVSNNRMDVKAPNLAFGIYSYPYMGAVVDMTVYKNVIVADAYASCGMEIVQDNPTISNNVIMVNGNHTVGIVANMNDNGTISDNLIASLGSNIGKNATGDSLIHPESTGISVKGDTLILNNSISSTSIGVNLILGGKFTLANNEMEIKAMGDTDNYGVYAKDIDALVACDNEIHFEGNTDGTIFSKAFNVDGVDGALIENNTFEVSLVSADVGWASGSSLVFSEGIAIVNSEGAIFKNNRAEITYSNFTGNYDTLYAVDLANSPNSVISNNNIGIAGYKYVYGITVTSTNFTIENNNITSIAFNYCAEAINPDAGASGIVKNNYLNALAPNVTYTVYSMMYGDPTGMDIDYIGNYLYGSAYYVNVFDIGGASENIINNTIIADGNYTVAIYSGSKENVISNNIIRALGSGQGNITMPYTKNENLAIKLVGNKAVISDNYIQSAEGDVAIDLGNTNATIENNFIASKKAVGNSAVANAGPAATIANNTPSLKLILASPKLDANYVEGVIYVVMAYDENGEPVANLTLISVVDGISLNATTDQDGYAAFVADLDAGYYVAETVFYGNDVYGPKSIKTSINVEPSATEIVAPASKTLLLTAVKKGTTIKITLKDKNGNGLANKDVSITFNGKTKTYTTNSAGVISYKLSATKTGSYKLTMNFAGDNNYVASTATSTIKLTKEASKLTAAKKTFKTKTKTKKYTVTLKDSKKKAIKKVKVTLKVKGKTYKATTNAKGKATFKITKLTKAGSYKATVKFAGNAYYKASTKSVKITVKK